MTGVQTCALPIFEAEFYVSISNSNFRIIGPIWAPEFGVGVLFLKIVFFIFFFMWVRWTIPRFRYDQLMNLGWKGLIPLAIANIIITGVVIAIIEKF